MRQHQIIWLEKVGIGGNYVTDFVERHGQMRKKIIIIIKKIKKKKGEKSGH